MRGGSRASLDGQDELRRWNQLVLATSGGSRGWQSKPACLCYDYDVFLHLRAFTSAFSLGLPGWRTSGRVHLCTWQGPLLSHLGNGHLLLLYLDTCQSIPLEREFHRSGGVACCVHCLGLESDWDRAGTQCRSVEWENKCRSTS